MSYSVIICEDGSLLIITEDAAGKQQLRIPATMREAFKADLFGL